MASRDRYLYLAKLAEKAARYEEMLDFMENAIALIPTREEPTVEERTLLFLAYKHVVGAKRGARIIISSIEKKERSTGNDKYVNANIEFKSKIETELSKICYKILVLLDSKLIPCATGGETMVFYLKMKGDYYRYLAEFKSDAQRIEAAESAEKAYKAAQAIATVELAPTHPSRLGLALNFSVFYYDILRSHERASSLAKKAYEEADAEISSLEDSSTSSLIMQLLLDNLSLWTPDNLEEEEDDDEDEDDGDSTGEIKEVKEVKDRDLRSH